MNAINALQRTGAGFALSALFSLSLVACGGGDGSTDSSSMDAPTSEEEWADDESEDEDASDDWGLWGTEDASEPFSEPFEGLVDQSVRWSTAEVRVTDARIFSPTEDEADAFFFGINEGEIYAELTVEFTNVGQRDFSLSDRRTWDLILSDGTRISPKAFDVLVAPGDATKVPLRYWTGERVDLRGAVLELNGGDRGVLAPEELPLDQSVISEYPMIPLAERVVLEAPSTELFVQLRHEIDSVVVDRNTVLGRGRRAHYGKKFVEVHSTVTCVAGFFNEAVSRDRFAIIVDGHKAFPDAGDSEVLDIGASDTFAELFEIDEGARSFELEFVVGWDDGIDSIERIVIELP